MPILQKFGVYMSMHTEIEAYLVGKSASCPGLLFIHFPSSPLAEVSIISYISSQSFFFIAFISLSFLLPCSPTFYLENFKPI